MTFYLSISGNNLDKPKIQPWVQEKGGYSQKCCTITVGDGVPHLKAGAAGQVRSKFVRQTFICVRTGVCRIQMGFLRIHMPLE